MDAPSKSCKRILSEFISIYRDLPQLWDTRCVGYTNRKVREQGYVIFLKRFRDTCPAITIKEIKSKINTVRTNFRRELKKVKESGYTYVSALWYFENLRFLEDHLGATAHNNHQDIKVSSIGNSFNFKITNVGSRPTLDVSESIVTRCNISQPNALGTSQEAKGNGRPGGANHDSEITSTNKPDHYSEDRATDDSTELPPILSVKVEIPESPEPEPINQIIQAPTSTQSSHVNRISAFAPNPVTVQSRRPLEPKRQLNQVNQTKRILESNQVAAIPPKQLEPNQQVSQAQVSEPIASATTSRQNQTEFQNDNLGVSPKHKNRKRKKEQNYDEELLKTVRSHFKEREEEVDLIAQAWALKLKRLKPEQRIFAEKFIGDIFMEAELGTLNRSSVKINS